MRAGEERHLDAEIERRVAERTAQLRAVVEELRENEERYRILHEAAFEGLGIHERGKILEANDAGAAMLGYETSGEFVGANVRDHVAPESREKVMRMMASGYEGVYEAVGMKKDGTRVILEVRGKPSRYRGRDVRLIAMRDVTELRNQERALRESEARYRAIFENAVEGIFQSTPDGRLLIANPAMARIFGYESPEALVSSVTDVARQLYADPSQREEFTARIRREGSVSGFEVQAVRRDGSVAWVSVNARLVRDQNGELSAYEGTVEDVTERVEARRTLERRVAALTRVASSLAVDQPIKSTLDSLATGVVETTGALACSVHLIDSRSRALLLTGSHGLFDGYPEAVRASWRAGGRYPALGSFESQRPVLLRRGRRLLLDDPLYAPIHGGISEAAWEAIYVVPLVARGESLGTIVLYYPQGAEPTEDETTFLEAVADQAALAVENSRLFSAAQGAAALQERQRLSRELHDSVSQALYGIALGSRTARTLLDRDPSRVAEPLEYVRSLAQAGLAEMRALIFELRPESLENEGLVAALEKQAAALQVRHELEVHASLCDEPDVPLSVKEALYRIAQEALHNTVKHARAENVWLLLKQDGEGIVLEVRDDGTGFDPSGSFPGHLGLKSMRERAARLDGTVEVESKTGVGTRILARVPSRAR